MVVAAEVEGAVVAEVLRSPVEVQDRNHRLVLHLVQNLHLELLADMVIREDHGILRCQEQIQQEHLVQAEAALVALVALDQILQGGQVDFIR
jgi:hypothetical protein